MRHAWVILAALAITALAPRAAVHLVATADVNTDGIAMVGAIEHPALSAALLARPAQTIVAPEGANITTVARTYHVDAGALRWANGIPDEQEPYAGQALLLPPGAGVVALVEPGERPSHFAARFGLDARVILDFNVLGSDSPQPAGTYLQLPAGAAVPGMLTSGDVVPLGNGIPGVSAAQGGTGSNAFPYGQCTWYVASRRNVTWNGDAWTWWGNARGIRPEGHIPVAGAIVVIEVGWSGHVGIVEHVNTDGSYVMAEMNYYGDGGGWGRVDHRTMAADEPGVLGYIY